MTKGVSDSQAPAFAKFKPLLSTVASSQLAASFDRMAESLKGASFSAIARFTLVSDLQAQSFTISLRERSAKVESDGKSLSEKVDLEIITTPETWLAIAEGKLAAPRCVHARQNARAWRL